MPDAVNTGTVDSGRLRAVFGAYPTGVVAVAGMVDGAPVGMAASSFISVSMDPPLVAFCVAHSSTTWPELMRASMLGITVLGAQQEAACRQLSAKGVDRFAGMDWHDTGDGAVLIEHAAAWLECSIYELVRAGDHDIVVLSIRDLRVDDEVHPLVFHRSRFRTLNPDGT